MNLYIVFSYIFLILLVQYIRIKKEKLYPVFKPLPIILLLLLVFIHLFEKPFGMDTLLYFFTGLSFGFFGDLLLLKKKFFYAGLFAFLIGHIFYIFVFIQYQLFIVPELFLLFIPALFYDSFLSYKIIKNQKKKFILIPLGLYFLVITFMVLTSINFEMSLLNIFPFFATGAVLFALSDAMLAWNKFVSPSKTLSVIYSVFYYAAQFFLTFGVLNYL